MEFGVGYQGKPERYAGEKTLAYVVRKERLSNSMLRLHFQSQEAVGFQAANGVDRYFKLEFPPAFGTERPRLRSYTIRFPEPEIGRFVIDFVVHGTTGLAAQWAVNSRIGDEMWFRGPGAGYYPSPEAPWHLLIGDLTALPAIAASLEALPAGSKAKAFILVDTNADRQFIDTVAEPVNGTLISWVRGKRGQNFVDAVTGWNYPDGDPHVFLHGEAGLVKTLRSFLKNDRGYSLENMSISGYWRSGATDEQWREQKADWASSLD